jgi:hypothetical protein
MSPSANHNSAALLIKDLNYLAVNKAEGSIYAGMAPTARGIGFGFVDGHVFYGR